MESVPEVAEEGNFISQAIERRTINKFGQANMNKVKSILAKDIHAVYELMYSHIRSLETEIRDRNISNSERSNKMEQIKDLKEKMKTMKNAVHNPKELGTDAYSLMDNYLRNRYSEEKNPKYQVLSEQIVRNRKEFKRWLEYAI